MDNATSLLLSSMAAPSSAGGCDDQTTLYLSVVAAVLAVVSEIMGAAPGRHNGLAHGAYNLVTSRCLRSLFQPDVGLSNDNQGADVEGSQ